MVTFKDTDLISPIRMVSVEQGKLVFDVCPGRWAMAPGLQHIATFTRHVHRRMLRAAQFPERIPRTTIRKPAGW